MRLTTAASALTALLLAATLSGCAVSVTDPKEPDTASPSESTAAPSGAAEKPSDTPEQADASTEGADPSRDDLIAAATRVMRCDGELTILDDAVSVYVEGECDRLILNSSGSQVATDDVVLLEVIGDANVVLAGTIGELLVNGTGNVVHWQGATPSVSDVGNANVLTAG